MITRRSIDRLTITTLALAAAMPFLAISPVHAAEPACMAEARSLRSDAAARPEAAAKTLRLVAVAEKICAEGNAHEANRKLARARLALNENIQLAERR